MFLPFSVFHGKLLFRIYPHNRAYGGVRFTAIFPHLKNALSKTIKEWNYLNKMSFFAVFIKNDHF
ncbi:hypothetical protein KVC90_05725 [Helicobacter pylori]|nr:hypothetical protein KVC90_05725 [Helicobacter pylori]